MTGSTPAILCPYCGYTQMAVRDRCTECGGLFEPLSRVATQIAMGPWYIRDRANPFCPGCCYEVLQRQVETGRINATTIIRGPTTRQFWSVARNVPGVAHLLGICHDCGAPVQPMMVACPRCRARFSEVEQRNELGLDFPTPLEARAARAGLDRQIAAATTSAADSTDSPSADHLMDGLRHAHGDIPTASGALTQLADATDSLSTSSATENRRGLVDAIGPVPDAATDEGNLPLAAPATGQALDFGPILAPAPWRDLARRIRPVSWILIAVNTCLFLLLIVLLVILLSL